MSSQQLVHSQAKLLEVHKFNQLASTWWDIDGPLKTLHHINPARLKFITDHLDLNNKSVIDIGCGGGILCESMAKQGAIVCGIDLAQQALEISFCVLSCTFLGS